MCGAAPARRGRLLLVALLLLAASTCASARRKSGGGHRHAAPRTTTPAPEVDICDIQEPGSPVFCYCKSGETGQVASATCLVFSTPPDDEAAWSAFQSQPGIRTLSLNVRGDGKLTRMPTRLFANLPQLEVLSLQYASINRVTPYALANSSSLREASLSRNQFVKLAPRAFHSLPRLESLYLSENRIQELHRDVFVDLPSLRVLALDRNNLSVLHERAFSQLPALQELDLHGNQLPAVTRATWAGLGALRRLDLSGNRLGAVADGTFQLLGALHELELAENDVEWVGARAFQGLRALRRLSLRDNQLAQLPGGQLLASAAALRVLDLRDNELTTLHEDTVRPVLETMTNASAYLYLEGNNLQCDCRLSWMYTLRNQTESKQVRNSLEELTCVLQEDVKGPAEGGDDDDDVDDEDDGGEEGEGGRGRMANDVGRFGSVQGQQQHLRHGAEHRRHPQPLPAQELPLDYVAEDVAADMEDGVANNHSAPVLRHLLQIPVERLPCPEAVSRHHGGDHVAGAELSADMSQRQRLPGGELAPGAEDAADGPSAGGRPTAGAAAALLFPALVLAASLPVA
ncbi:connectin-like [Schistocerca nitens]|uniref:connectin-like n=1 Tax=Schistocerca nitens TaxID=7011 RepID=UPI002119136D|nr:connectin-like [Schistocerca nitens]XP_049795360.1 connectin-like [Schistocerca nitens]